MVIKKQLTSEENKKIQTDLDFLKKIINFAKENKFRLVVSGGYGLDGVLGQITRPHNDIDVILYGQKSREDAENLLTDFISSVDDNLLTDIKKNTFTLEVDINSEGLGVNIYNVQTKNDPFINLNEIIKSDGQIIINSEEGFPLPVQGNLEGLVFEAQNPNLHLADILFKRRDVDQSKHEQDIQNLKQITDPQIVEAILSQY